MISAPRGCDPGVVTGKAAIEVGRTYCFDGWPESQKGRKALVLARIAEGLYSLRSPDGRRATLGSGQLRGPVEPARPGVDEPCLRCNGSKEIDVQRHDPQRPWIVHTVGSEPCPNCAQSP